MTTARTQPKAARPAFVCDACGHQPPKWLGRCPECHEWGSVIESTVSGPVVSGRVVASRLPSEPARPDRHHQRRSGQGRAHRCR